MGGMEDYYIAQFFCWREIILLNLEIDIETFSSVNLAKAGVYRYAESPDFEVGLDDAKNEMIRMEELEQARKEVDKAEDKKPMKQNMFKVV